MKILLVNTLYTPNIVGGAERSVQFLAEALVVAGHEVAVVCLTSSPDQFTNNVNGVRVYYLPLINVYWPFDDNSPNTLKKLVWHGLDSHNPWMARSLGTILDQERPDVVNTNNLAGFSAKAWDVIKRRGFPLVHTLRDYALLCPRATMYRNGNNCEKPCSSCRLFSAPRRGPSRFPDAVIGISQFVLDRHLAHGFFDEVKHTAVIHNIYARPEGETAKSAPRQTDTNDTPLSVGYLGQIEKVKGVEQLLEAVRTLPEDRITLNVAGRYDSPWAAALKQKYSGPNIEFLGFVRPEEAFQNMDLLVVPSLWHEPLGRIIFEAYSHGIPVLASNRGGIPEIVNEGKTGWVYEASDSGALKRKLAMLIDEKAVLAEMQSGCLARSGDFLPTSIVSSYEDIYRHTVEANS